MKKILAFVFTMLLFQSCLASTIYTASGLYGLKDENNNIILKAQYDEITKLKYTPPKTILIPMQATEAVKTVESNYYKVKKNNLFGIINTEGKIIREVKYDDVKLNENGEIILVKDGEEIVANPLKNSMKTTGKTLESIIGLPVTVVAGVMVPIEMISKIGRK